MPEIFDNIKTKLVDALNGMIPLSKKGDFCVGYFNLRGWKEVCDKIDHWAGGEGACCRLLVGMQKLPKEDLQNYFRIAAEKQGLLDQETAAGLKKRLAEEFRNQLALGLPDDVDEAGLRRLARQLREKKVIVKLFMRYQLHAKLYLLYRDDPATPKIGYLGSSNLTFAGLSGQGELNIDVVDKDAGGKLEQWFKDRWEDDWCIDISKELIEIIESSWAGEKAILPYYIYLKIAYELSKDAREGVGRFKLPQRFEKELLKHQKVAVKIAAHHINHRGGVLVGDVVGLGKTLIATAIAAIMENDQNIETLILCPKNLEEMWDYYRKEYGLRGQVIPISMAVNDLPSLKHYKLVLIDESHNLRNREGKKYQAILDYILKNSCKCILLTATPYNKEYLDISSQLRLFIPQDIDLGIRPEKLFKELGGEQEFLRQYQVLPRSILAFEKSGHVDDWRELLRLYMLRRTRGFIEKNYGEAGSDGSGRKCLKLPDGTEFYFPKREPKTVKFPINPKSKADQYARLFSQTVVDTINDLELSRYGLGKYINSAEEKTANQAEERILNNLSRANKLLKGFCRTGLYKRLESSGYSFLKSLERHILRNCVYVYAFQNNLPIPIGSIDASSLDVLDDEDEESDILEGGLAKTPDSLKEYMGRAKEIYKQYSGKYKNNFDWVRTKFFEKKLQGDLEADNKKLFGIADDCGAWNSKTDEKLKRLIELLKKDYPKEKVLIFSEYADTVRYLEAGLEEGGIKSLDAVTGNSENPTHSAWKFSPESNKMQAKIKKADETRILLATDVLSEGQNLQDGYVIVNFDIPWAIIRLIQRAGRVDRIGQKSETVFCHTFMPADGVEQLIKLRERIYERLRQNSEVVGSDEIFFEHMKPNDATDIYNEKAGIYDEKDTGDVDLVSQAYEIWKQAVEKDPSLKTKISAMANVVYSTKPAEKNPEGVVVYVKNPEGTDSLAFVDKAGKTLTESQQEILKIVKCAPDTPAIPRIQNHHALVKAAAENIVLKEGQAALKAGYAGNLGPKTGARYRAYFKLVDYIKAGVDPLFESNLIKAKDEIYEFQFTSHARDRINSQLRLHINDYDFSQLILNLRDEGRLVVKDAQLSAQDPYIVCSLGMKHKD